MGTQLPLPEKKTEPPNFRPMSIVAKRLDRSRWHLAWRWASVQATLCEMGTQLPPQKRGRAPQMFGPYLLWPNGWMDQGATWYGGRPRLRRHCVRWRPSSPSPKRGRSLQILDPCLLWPNGCMYQDTTGFWSISIVAKWLDG